MSPRKRSSENRGLPLRWQHHHGTYYYRVPPGQEHVWDGKRRFPLGKTLAEAYQTWVARMKTPDRPTNMGGLFDRYELEVVPTKAPRTQVNYIASLKRLRRIFGHLPIRGMRPAFAYEYIDRYPASKRYTGRVTAVHDVEVLRHALTKAVEWGYIDRNPLIGQVNLRGRKARPRTRYVEDWEVLEALRLPSKRKRGSVRVIQAYIRVKLLTGLRRNDLLMLRTADITDDGIRALPHKTAHTTGRSVIVEWDDAGMLRAALDDALAMRPVDIGPYVFCTAKGECYVKEDGSAYGWQAMWQRFMQRVLAETKVTERFTDIDLRAKCASDLESLKHAQELLVHGSPTTTQRWYRRKPTRVKPGKGIAMTQSASYDPKAPSGQS
jgi:integrase